MIANELTTSDYEDVLYALDIAIEDREYEAKYTEYDDDKADILAGADRFRVLRDKVFQLIYKTTI